MKRGSNVVRDLVGRRRAPAVEQRPSFFLVGAPKCGTTALYTYLKPHPDVFLTQMREPMFFGSDLYCPPERRLTLDRYLALFSGARGERCVGECSTRYFVSKRAADEIHRFEPAARIIVMLRSPVEMMHSLHSQLLYSGEEHIENFEAALADEERRRALLEQGDPPPIAQVLVYRDVAHYTDHVERYFSVFGRENVHVIVLEEFARDTRQAYKQVLQFLGADPDFEPSFEVVNQFKVVRSKRLDDLLLHPPQPLQTLSRRVPARLRRAAFRTTRALNTRPGQRPEIPARLRLELETELTGEIERLETLLARDLSCWRSRAP